MSEGAVVIFCLVPAELEQELFEPLRRHYASHPRVRVLVDRRRQERRRVAAPDLRPVAPGQAGERRAAADRRRPVLQRTIDAFPEELLAHRHAVRFVQRLMPVTSGLESLTLEAVLERVRDGDAAAPTELYWRCFERIQTRLRLLLGPRSADAAVAAAFARVLDAVETAPDPLEDFDELLFSAVDAGVADRPELPQPPPAAAPELPSLAVSDPLLDEPVRFADRDPRWFERAQSERDALVRRGGVDVVAVEHIGGTALPGLPSRPVVDLLVGVEAVPLPLGLHLLLLERGYEDCGDAGRRGRAFYRRRGLSSCDVHVVQHDGPLWRAAVLLRDHLWRNRGDAEAWARARRDAARDAPDSLLRYSELRAPALAALVTNAVRQNPQRAA